MKYDGKYTLSPDIVALEQKYSQDLDELRLTTPGRTPTTRGFGLSRRSSMSSSPAVGRATRSSPLVRSTPDSAAHETDSAEAQTKA